MNRDEARYILRAYQVGGDDASDPQFREALEMMKLDPELQEWFRQEEALDAVVARKLQSFPVPSDLKSQLLAARKVVDVRHWWKTPCWWKTIAAMLAVL